MTMMTTHIGEYEMSRFVSSVFKTDKFSLSLCTDGYYLYDYELGMNISMYANAEQDAFIEALEYYQRRLVEVKADYNNLRKKVNSFLVQFDDDVDEV